MDKGGCISFRGRAYEVSAALIGAMVEIAYDPRQPNPLLVSCRDMPPVEAKLVAISPFCDKKPELPVCLQSEESETSRFLDVLEHKHTDSQVKLAIAISLSCYRKESR